MSEQGAVLQSYNQELVKYIENLKTQREIIISNIDEEEKKKKSILLKMEELQKQLNAIEVSLEDKYAKRTVCDKAIKDAETGLLKIIESSKVLLTLMQQETQQLNNTT